MLVDCATQRLPILEVECDCRHGRQFIDEICDQRTTRMRTEFSVITRYDSVFQHPQIAECLAVAEPADFRAMSVGDRVEYNEQYWGDRAVKVRLATREDPVKNKIPHGE
jgi:hypothetical protein